jgi:GR25 family glycosyltransferase involved in LPS biosynthesis
MEILGKKISDIGYFINLPESIDRLNNVNSQIDKYSIKNLIRFEALTDPWHQTSCTKSHRGVFKLAKQKGYEIISVFEDDFQINDNINYYFKQVDFKTHLDLICYEMGNIEWDVILLGCNPTDDIVPITKHFGKITKSTGAWGYIIKKRAYEYILDNFDYSKDYLAIDNILPKLNEFGFTTLTTIPMLFHHAVGFISTLERKGPVNYTVWIDGSWDKHLYNITNE